MENHLLASYKKNLDLNLFKNVRVRFHRIDKKFEEQVKNLCFGRKKLLRTLCKNYYLFEKLIIRQITKAFKDRQDPETKPKNFEEIVKNDKIEKKFRKGLFKLEEELKATRLTKEKLETEMKETENQMEKSKRKQEYHIKVQEKAKRRTENFQQLKKIWSQTPEASKPKFQDMEESFKTSYEQFQMQKTRHELAKISEKMKPISKHELVSHIKCYKTIITEAKRIREAKFAEFSLQNLASPINYLKKEIKEEEKAKFNRKKMMMNKRKYYSDLVKQLFSPHPELRSLVSEKELKDIKTPKNERESEDYLQVLREKRKNLKRNVTPEPVLQKEEKLQVKKDYLGELRECRNHKRENLIQNFSFDEIKGSKSEVIKKLQKFEKVVLSEEHNIRMTEQSSMKEAELEVKLNELLMQSVKAKMQLINNININPQ